MTAREIEAYELVCKLNAELYARFGDKDESPGFAFIGSEYECAILWGDVCVWDSENSPSYDDDDNEIPIESSVRDSMDKLATAAEWIAKDHAREKISLDHCLFFLNELVKVDPEGLRKLVEARVPCNEALADHATVQVQATQGDGWYEVGLLGILNGLFGSYREGPKKGWGQIAAVFEDDGRLTRFQRTSDPSIKPVEICDACGGEGLICQNCGGSAKECSTLEHCKWDPDKCAVCQGRGGFPKEQPKEQGSMTAAWDTLGPEGEEHE